MIMTKTTQNPAENFTARKENARNQNFLYPQFFFQKAFNFHYIVKTGDFTVKCFQKLSILEGCSKKLVGWLYWGLTPL